MKTPCPRCYKPMEAKDYFSGWLAPCLKCEVLWIWYHQGKCWVPLDE